MDGEVNWNLEHAITDYEDDCKEKSLLESIVWQENMEAAKDVLKGNRGVIVNVEE